MRSPTPRPRASLGRDVSRPDIIGRHQAVVTGHPLATLAAMRILDSGGNAVDAGVAAGLAISVLQPDVVQLGGVAPIILYRAETREVTTISGLGRWPRRASLEFFERNTNGTLPVGLLRSVVPAGIDAWVTALQEYGTRTFAEVASAAIELARGGFAVHRLLHQVIADKADAYARWPSSAAVFLRDGRAPAVGEPFVQRELAAMLEQLVAEEASAGGGRQAALQAVKDAYYRGPVGAAISDYYTRENGLLAAADLAEFRVKIEPALSVKFGPYEVMSCGPWCQGPVLLEFLNLVELEDLAGLGHNTARYVHRTTEAMKLGFADREAYFGDPEFVDVPMATLLSKDYARERARCIQEGEATPDMPSCGDVGAGRSAVAAPQARLAPASDAHLDTTYLCVVDRHGNAFSATPSDGSYNAPLVPGLGFAVSPRGSQSWLTRGHPSAVEPWKRPRLTPNPALVLKEGRLSMVLGSPGGDVQCQAMLQVFLNIAVFGMGVQEAIDKPRFFSASFPSSFYPHASQPGKLILDSELAGHAEALQAKGHRAEAWTYRDWRGGGVCAIVVDPDTGFLAAGADPRRECYALAW